jgi:hypothetical protein
MTVFSNASFAVSLPELGGELIYKYLSLIDLSDFREALFESAPDEPAKNGDDPEGRVLPGCEDVLLIDIRAFDG